MFSRKRMSQQSQQPWDEYQCGYALLASGILLIFFPSTFIIFILYEQRNDKGIFPFGFFW